MKISCESVWGELGADKQGESRKLYSKHIKGWLEKEEAERKKPEKKKDENEFQPLSKVRLGCFMGGDKFRDFIQGIITKNCEIDQEVVGYKKWRKETPRDDMLRIIARVRESKIEELAERRREHGERDIAIYLCREAGEKSLKEIGEKFGVKRVAAGHAVSRVKDKRKREAEKEL